MLKIMGKAQVSDRNYGQKIIRTRKGEYNNEYQHKSYQ